MANIKIPKSWEVQKIKPVDEKIYVNRRKIIKQLGLMTGGLLAGSFLSGCEKEPRVIPTPPVVTPPPVPVGDKTFTFEGMNNLYPATLNPKYELDRTLSLESDVLRYNNFYEFIPAKELNNEARYDAYKYVSDFDNRDWKIQVTGLANKTGFFDLGDIIQSIGLEERTYRHRCVERWSMAVPWTGFPLSKLIQFFEPDNKATHIRTVSKANPATMIGVREMDWFPWAYFEGLRIEEAMNELAFVATGLYGKPLAKQNGAPIRLVIPWKYGYKSPKSIIKIEFLDAEPETFWHQIAPDEYSFLSNVDPTTPHPAWSQELETKIINGDIVSTLPYNGYGEYVANLYK